MNWIPRLWLVASLLIAAWVARDLVNSWKQTKATPVTVVKKEVDIGKDCWK